MNVIMFNKSVNLAVLNEGDTEKHLNQTCNPEETSMQVLLAIFYSFFFIFGVVTNAIALWVFLFLTPKKNSVLVFLINVAVADLLLAACMPFRILYHAHGNIWTLGPVFCRVVGNVFYMNMYVSITLLGLISVDRYLKIERTSRFKLKRAWSMNACCAIWAISILSIIPLIVFSEDNEHDPKCFHYKQRQKVMWKAYFNSIVVAVFWIVFLAFTVSYGKIALKLIHTSKEKPDLPNADKYRRTAKKSFFVLLLFTVCFIPYHTVRIFYIHSQLHAITCPLKNILDKANEVALLFSTFNSCLDPLMYFLLCGSVRKTFLQIIRKFFNVGDMEDSSSTANVHTNNKTPLASMFTEAQRCSEHEADKTVNSTEGF